MSDTLMMIIGIFVAVILMFLFPLVEFTGKMDEISQTIAQVAVSDFVNSVAEQGKITSFDYNGLVHQLYSTGNTFEIQIEAQIMDDNPTRATVNESGKLKGENRYYSVYTDTILDKIKNSENEEYQLKKDDYILVSVKNSNTTIGTMFKNLFYKLVGKDTYVLGASAGATILN